MSFHRGDAEAFLASPLARFSPWEHNGRSPQRDFLRAAGTNRTRIVRAGNQTGKTFIGAYDRILALLGWHPFCRFEPPLYGWISALDWEFGVGQILWPKIKAFLPWDRVRSVLWYRKQKDVELPATIVFDNGSRVDFKSAETGRTKYQGAPLHFVWADEEHPADIGEEIKARLLKYGGEFIMTLTPVRRERWILDVEKESETHVTRMSSMDAAHAGILNLAAVESFAANLPDRQRAVRIDGDFAALEGLVYPSFHRSTHVLVPRDGQLFRSTGEATGTPWPLPPSWPRFASMDFGFSNPACCVVTALDPVRMALVVERVFYCSSIRASRWGTILSGAIPTLSAPVICDHDAGERAELEFAGMPTLPAEKDIAAGLDVTERWLEPNHVGDGRPRLEIVVDEAHPLRHPDTGRIDGRALQDELEGYRYPDARTSGRVVSTRGDPKDVPIKKDDHACDALRYLLMYVEKRWRPDNGPLVLGAPDELYDGRLKASAPGLVWRPT